MSIDAVSKYKFTPDSPAIDNADSFAALHADLLAIEVDKKLQPCIKFSEGRYYYSGAPNFAFSNLDLRGEGQVEFVYTGNGEGFVFDGTPPGGGAGGKGNILVDNIRFVPSTSGTDTLILRSIHHSLFRVKAYGAAPPRDGFRNKAVSLYFCVCTRFDDLTVTPFDREYQGRLYEQCIGLWLDHLVGHGELPCCDCQFNNPVLEDCAVGAQIQAGVGNQFFGGTIENCTDIGMSIQDGESNKTWALWFESNKNYDLVISSKAKGNILDTKHPSNWKVQNNSGWFAGNSIK